LLINYSFSHSGDQTSSVNLRTLEEVIGRAEQQQLAHFKQHFDNQFAKLNRRLDRVQHCNEVEYAKKTLLHTQKALKKLFQNSRANHCKKLKRLTPYLAARP
jgi:hypothetical protein